MNIQKGPFIRVSYLQTLEQVDQILSFAEEENRGIQRGEKRMEQPLPP